jgi:hypothetical protein
MSSQGPAAAGEMPQDRRSLFIWEDEGGAGPYGPAMASPSSEAGSAGDRSPVPATGEAELVALHIRVIALENLLVAMLATASDGQLELARKMAPFISPRLGSSHAMTTHAAAHMVDLLERAARFHSGELQP